MKYLIVIASKHGATHEIGEAIASTLRGAGHEAQVIKPQDLTAQAKADALIIGSAIYMGNWMKTLISALPTVRSLGEQMPVWAFSSGPVGDPLLPKEDPANVTAHIQSLQALPDFRGHQLFAGAVIPEKLKTSEKLILKMVKAASGDYRQWNKIEQWATQIGSSN